MFAPSCHRPWQQLRQIMEARRAVSQLRCGCSAAPGLWLSRALLCFTVRVASLSRVYCTSASDGAAAASSTQSDLQPRSASATAYVKDEACGRLVRTHLQSFQWTSEMDSDQGSKLRTLSATGTGPA